MKMKTLTNGIFKENPIFVQLLGMCPTLAVTTSATNGFAMGAATTAVLVAANLVISLMRKIIPNKIKFRFYRCYCNLCNHGRFILKSIPARVR